MFSSIRARGLFVAALVFMTLSSPAYADANPWKIGPPHPAAALHPSPNGRMILELFEDEGRIWAGYGDYDQPWTDIPPIKLYWFKPDTRSWHWKKVYGTGIDDPYEGPRTLDGNEATAFTFQTDAVHQFRKIGNDLWAPAYDPRAGAADFAILNQYWRQSNAINRSTAPAFEPAHIYDVVGFQGDVYAAGSAFTYAGVPSSCTLWKSSDNGSSWTLFKRFTPVAGYSYSRCYFIQTYKKQLWVQPFSWHFSGPHGWARTTSESYRYDGVTWRKGKSILADGGTVGSTINRIRIGQGARPEVFDNPDYRPYTSIPTHKRDDSVMILLERSPGLPDGNGRLIAFNGKQRGRVISPTGSRTGSVWDFAVHDGYLYVLMTNGVIKRTNFVPVEDGGRVVWSKRLAHRPQARSLEVMSVGGITRIVAGQRNSRIGWLDLDCNHVVHPEKCTPLH